MNTTITPDIVAFPFRVVRRDGKEIIVALPDDGTPVGVQGQRLMELECRIRERFGGAAFEVYCETTDDSNKPRQDVAERVREWRQRRLGMNQHETRSA